MPHGGAGAHEAFRGAESGIFLKYSTMRHLGPKCRKEEYLRNIPLTGKKNIPQIFHMEKWDGDVIGQNGILEEYSLTGKGIFLKYSTSSP